MTRQVESTRSFPGRKLVAAAVLVVLVWWAESELQLSRQLEPDAIRGWLEAAGPAAPLLFMAVMASAIVVSPIPTLPLDIAAGTFFGPLLGTVYAVTGALLGSVISFAIARFLGRDAVAKLLGGHISFCETCSNHLLFGVVLVSRLVPVVSFDLVSYGAGLTRMSVGAFALATGIGMIPLTYLYVAFGAAVVARPELAIGLGLLFVASFLLLPRLIERYDLLGLRKHFRH